MASSHAVVNNDQFLDGNIVFEPRLTSTQLGKPKTPNKSNYNLRRKRPNRVLQEPTCNEITSYWRTTKRNRLDTPTLGKGTIMEEEDVDFDFYNNDAHLDIVWADDNSNRYRKNLVNLKPIEKTENNDQASVHTSTNTDDVSTKSESTSTYNSNQVKQVEFVLNNLISCLRVDPSNNIESQCDLKSQKVKQNSPIGNDSSQSFSSIGENSIHCDNDVALSQPGCQEIIASSTDEDLFENDDCDWLSQIPDEDLLLDAKAFVEKGDNGVISKALLRPRENVPVPRREEVILKPNSQSSNTGNCDGQKILTDSSMADQENKNVLNLKERKTIPPQLIRRSKLSFITDNNHDTTTIVQCSNRHSTTKKPGALGEVTNTLGASMVNSDVKQTFNDEKMCTNDQIQVKFVQPVVTVFSQPPSVAKELSLNDIKVDSKDDNEFEFDDDDDELFKAMDLDLPNQSSSTVTLSKESESSNVQEMDNVKMDQDSFVWEEEADDICRNIDLSIFK